MSLICPDFPKSPPRENVVNKLIHFGTLICRVQYSPKHRVIIIVVRAFFFRYSHDDNHLGLPDLYMTLTRLMDLASGPDFVYPFCENSEKIKPALVISAEESAESAQRISWRRLDLPTGFRKEMNLHADDLTTGRPTSHDNFLSV